MSHNQCQSSLTPTSKVLRPSPTDLAGTPLPLPSPSQISSYWWVAQPLPGQSSPAPLATGIPEAGCREVSSPMHTEGYPPPPSGTNGWVSTQRASEETGQIQLGWWFGWWPFTSHGSDHLPGGGHCWRVGWTLQAPLFPWPWIPHSHLMTMATSADSMHPWKELTQMPLSNLQLLINLDPSPSLGGCLTHWTTPMPESRHRGTGREITLIGGRRLQPITNPTCSVCPQQTWSLAPFLVAGHSLQAAPSPTLGIRLVGWPTLSYQTMSPRFPATHVHSPGTSDF